ncbi:efflux transporter outer membrane subunit [Burkholderia multivorans]|uniref:efflux transporter outer membrane subunit n=1 Tax=Burkholderia multivorans TaxID=87883 RepID=UPI0021C0042F|nr:efflux transporter outer membrane subunit [Burkholderia multivorans]
MPPRLLAPILFACALAGCAHVAEMPAVSLPEAPAYRGGPQAAAVPALQRDTWWTLYQDPELDRLQQQLLANSPDLGSALARYQQARAATDALRAARLPSVGASAEAVRNRQSENRPLRGASSPDYYNSGTLGLSLDYELDLWGRIGRQVAAGVAEEQAAQADLAGAQLALQAQLADTLLALRGADQEIALLRETQAAFARATGMVGERHRAGLASGLDLARAEAQQESARSQLHQVQAQRDVLAHAIAALVGAHASAFSIEPAELPDAVPPIPAGLPSELLQRRPDIAAAQRRVAAANASVGVARTAFFPSLRLSAQGGWQSSDLGNIVAAPNVFWAIGSGLLVNLFDGGRRRAEVARAEAVLDETGQTYRATVLGAFQQVEDQLALLREYGEAGQAEQRTVTAAHRALDMATSRYRDGAASYLDVVAAQTTHLQARRNALDLNTRQRRATVQLVRALGGGWSQDQSWGGPGKATTAAHKTSASVPQRGSF